MLIELKRIFLNTRIRVKRRSRRETTFVIEKLPVFCRSSKETCCIQSETALVFLRTTRKQETKALMAQKMGFDGIACPPFLEILPNIFQNYYDNYIQ